MHMHPARNDAVERSSWPMLCRIAWRLGSIPNQASRHGYIHGHLAEGKWEGNCESRVFKVFSTLFLPAMEPPSANGHLKQTS